MTSATVSKEYLVAHFAEFSAESSERIATVAETAALFIDDAVFGNKAQYSLALMIAHMLKISGNQGAAGAIVSQSVGDLSESFATPSGKNALSLTSYGQELQRIMKLKSVCARPLFV